MHNRMHTIHLIISLATSLEKPSLLCALLTKNGTTPPDIRPQYSFFYCIQKESES